MLDFSDRQGTNMGKEETVDLCAYGHKVETPTDKPSEALMTQIMINVSGNNFQLFDDGDLTKETSHTSSKK